MLAELVCSGHPSLGLRSFTDDSGYRRFLDAGWRAGAWGVVPAHLNELSPDAVRSLFPGFVYQLEYYLARLLTPLNMHCETVSVINGL